MSANKTISLMLTGMDTGSILNRAIEIVNDIWTPAEVVAHSPKLSELNCLRVNLSICDGEVTFPAQFFGSTLFVIDCARVDIHQRKQDGDEIWSDLLTNLRTQKPLSCREDRPLIFLFLNAHTLPEGNLMKLRAFIEVCYTGRIVWIGWDPRYICPKSIVSRFVGMPVMAGEERESLIQGNRELLIERIQGSLCEANVWSIRNRDANAKVKILFALRKIVLRLLCLPFSLFEVLTIVRDLLIQRVSFQSMEDRVILETTQHDAVKMIRGGVNMPHLALEYFVLKVCEELSINCDDADADADVDENEVCD